MSPVIEVAAPAELPDDLTGVPILHIIVEMFLPCDMVHMGIVPKTCFVVPENMIEDLLRVVGINHPAPAVTEPILELDHRRIVPSYDINLFGMAKKRFAQEHLL